VASTDRVLCETLFGATRHLWVLTGTDGVCDMLCCAKRHLRVLAGTGGYWRVLAGTDRVLRDMPYVAKLYLWMMASADRVVPVGNGEY